jgi:hypothetical protein
MIPTPASDIDAPPLPLPLRTAPLSSRPPRGLATIWCTPSRSRSDRSPGLRHGTCQIRPIVEKSRIAALIFHALQAGRAVCGK